MQKLDTMNHAQRAAFARALHIRNAHGCPAGLSQGSWKGAAMRSDNDSGCGLSGPAQDWADEAWRIRAEAIAKGMEEGK